ncbi:hypothetical protein [Streptomyces huiliensis]|uniref:hypothetical protein n=1 Tax=Streptomyces huiliensis TaxID=2876027 RepID=UPI001CC14C5C|nr:hypothetical protein [Streptomyces huiliensis]MBZ4322365.1 hypothetical protein [Streptomyces huiliensis]
MEERKRPRKNWRYPRFVRLTTSPIGYPVPAAPRYASARRVRELVETAEREGFSRTAKGVEEVDADGFLVSPYHPEPSPQPSWMCYLFALTAPDPAGWRRTLRGPFRIDIRMREFYALPKARRRTVEDFLPFLAAEAQAAARAKERRRT